MFKHMLVLAAVVVAAVIAAAATPAAGYGANAFTGAWIALDTDGDYAQLEIGAPDAAGVQPVTIFDIAADVCNRRSANAHGSGTVAGDTLTATLTIVCQGRVTYVGDFHFTLSGDGTLLSDTAPTPYMRR